MSGNSNIRLVVFGAIIGLAVIADLPISRAEVCNSERPLVNDDFEISCLHLEVKIFCKKAVESVWSNLPEGRLNLTQAKKVTIQNCALPIGLSLLNVTKALGIETNDTVKIEQACSKLRKEHLSGFQLASLHLLSSNISHEDEHVSADLLSEVEIEMLMIQNVSIRMFPKNFFRGSEKLREIEITGAGLKAIRRDDLAPLVGLKNLLLFSNEIAEIEPGSFDQLLYLKLIEISKNRLKNLPAGLFRRLMKLERLNLSENEFDDLPSDLLRIERSRIKLVRLNHNRGGLQALPAGFFRNLSNLNYVELTSNNFISIPADVFYGAHSLHSLNISNNSLSYLPPKLFEGTSSLVDLRASENRLVELPDGLFKDCEDLERLYFNDNLLTNLSNGVFTGLSNLKIMQLSHNNLVYMELNACALKSVESVDLSNNQLTLASPTVWPYSFLLGCASIIDLNLSYNNITQFFIDWRFLSLKNLNLEGNKITYISKSNFDMLRSKTELNLKNNKISTIDLEGLENLAMRYQEMNGLSKELIVKLEDNPLNCDCHLLDFFRYLEHGMDDEVYNYVHISARDMRCVTPPQLKGSPISTIRSEDLRCLTKSNDPSDACSGKCTCWRIPGRKVLSVDCSHRNLTSVPSMVNNSENWSIELNMTGNRLHSTPKMNNSYLANVTALNLSFNNISDVRVDVFSNSLRDLRLHNNSISRINYYVVQHLYDDDDLLRNLTLHGNPWICDCETRNMLNFVQKKLTTYKLHDVTCRENNRKLSEVTADELCEGMIKFIVFVAFFFAACIAVGSALAAFYFKYKMKIKMWLYSKQCCLWFVTEAELDKDKLYDAFISFSHKDEDFVEKEIVTKLEEGPMSYKLCLHYRDWLAGEWIPEQIARSVEESKRTIVIVSPNFLESVWARIEFRTAYNQALKEGRARVIVVLYGNIGNTAELDPELQVYLSMNTYLKWGDPWFWDKLRYALPHKQELPKKKKRSKNARIIEKHLSQLPVNNHRQNEKTEVIPMPKITAQSDSTKLLESNAEEERHLGA
ncbi:protein toll [Copidosoma floridanum]|uniref:protein toll n=1 Tax=Copidosoma floridanum TaxID=29053 RepID=UPI0006C9BCAE|nr:protein toll [Copidosoma floridanum]